MKEVFKERLDNRIEVFILFGCLTFIWFLSDYPWISLIIGLIIYFWFRTRYYYFVFTESELKIIYPLIPKQSVKINFKEVSEIHHMINNSGGFARRRSDLLRVISTTTTYQVAIQREPEDFRKINELIHCSNWRNKLKTNGDASNIQEIITRRESGWIK